MGHTPGPLLCTAMIMRVRHMAITAQGRSPADDCSTSPQIPSRRMILQITSNMPQARKSFSCCSTSPPQDEDCCSVRGILSLFDSGARNFICNATQRILPISQATVWIEAGSASEGPTSVACSSGDEQCRARRQDVKPQTHPVLCLGI